MGRRELGTEREAVRPPRARRQRREHDVPAVRFVARGRVLAATAAVILASLLPVGGSRGDALLYLLGLFWVPWSGWLALNADRLAPRFVRLAGSAGDLAVLLASGSLVPGSAPAVALGGLIVVLLGAYTGGVGEGAVLSGCVLVVFTAAPELAPRPAGPRPLDIALLASVLGLLLWVVERGSSQQRRASMQSERLRGRSGAILERVADGVVVTDGTGRVLEANPAACRVIERASGEVRGRHCGEVLRLGMGERQLDCGGGCALLGLAGGEQGDGGHEVWRITADGRRQPLLANVCAIAGADGQVDEIVHSLRDITSLKQADEAKTLFLATASHELRTPLTVIRGYGEMLLESPELSADGRARAAEAIVRRAEELSRIVDGLLLSSRIESGRLQLTVGAVRLGPILEERGRSLEAATGRSVELVVAGDLPSAVADPGAFTTVVDHLLDNAVKYSPEGAPVVLGAEASNGHVRVKVADRGVGMTSEQAARCFDKFWQADSTDERGFKGSGIGLYIVRSVVEAMGGRIEVDTAPGRGTTFTFSLRRADPETTEPGVLEDRRAGEDSIVREFMRQIGIPEGSR